MRFVSDSFYAKKQTLILNRDYTEIKKITYVYTYVLNTNNLVFTRGVFFSFVFSNIFHSLFYIFRIQFDGGEKIKYEITENI